MNQAKNIVKAYHFNKDKAYNKCVLYKTLGDVFAADIYAHKNCMKKFFKNIWVTLMNYCIHIMMLNDKKLKHLKFRLQLMNFVEVWIWTAKVMKKI